MSLKESRKISRIVAPENKVRTNYENVYKSNIPTKKYATNTNSTSKLNQSVKPSHKRLHQSNLSNRKSPQAQRFDIISNIYEDLKVSKHLSENYFINKSEELIEKSWSYNNDSDSKCTNLLDDSANK